MNIFIVKASIDLTMKINKTFFVLMTFALITKISAQQDKPYTCHEWGTFTSLFSSNGQQLDGLYLEEEPLPSFCYNLDRNFLATFSSKGVNKTKLYSNFNEYGNAFIKMETPDKQVTVVPVLKEGKFVGSLRLHDIFKAGFNSNYSRSL